MSMNELQVYLFVTMRKEVIFAILIGLSLGLVITYGIYRARMSLNTPPQLLSENGTSPTPSPETVSNLLITNPDDEAIVDQKQIPVAGTTTANAFIVVIVNDNEYITTADETGNFSVEVELANNSNVIQVFTLDEDGSQSMKELTVIYTTQPLEGSGPEATTSAQTSQEEDE